MTHYVDIADTTIPDGIENIIANLPPISSLKDGEKIILRFGDQHVFRTGLVLLSTWRKTLPEGIDVRIDDSQCREGTRRLIDNSGFRDIIEQNEEQPTHIFQGSGKVPLQPVVRGYSTEHAIGRICSVIDEYAALLHDTKPFRVMLSELCENAYAHSEFETSGYLCAHLYERNMRCEISIADSGIGIRNSYLEGTNEEAKRRISEGACPIDLAIEGLRSSKPTPIQGTSRSHFGYGLFIVRRLIEENRGRLVKIGRASCRERV